MMQSSHRPSSFTDDAHQTYRASLLASDRPSSFHESAIDDSPHSSSSFSNYIAPPETWRPRSNSRDARRASNSRSRVTRHGRNRSFTETLQDIKNRRGSVSNNAHELADKLRAPISLKLVGLCGLWYMTSIFSSASSKSILTAFRKPVTLTIVQFFFVSSWCIILSYLAKKFPIFKTWVPALRYSIILPSREIILTTLPLTAFQIGGHILNSESMARIPVSLVHTIKGLSPLFTVLAYRLVFRVHYSTATYLALVPLTLGVIMACSANFGGSAFGLLLSFASALLFVTQNIVSKRIFNEAARAEAEGTHHLQAARTPDKLNLLCYSSGIAFLLTCPLWLWSEGFGLFGEIIQEGAVELSERPDALDHGRLAIEFIFNGTFHFAQSLVAFVLLSLISPVTYSVASLMKRVFVITFSIFWFSSPMTHIQATGIALTFIGLYLYDRTNDATRADRQARLLEQRAEKPVLPTIMPLKKDDSPSASMPPGGLERSPPAQWGLPGNGLAVPDIAKASNGRPQRPLLKRGSSAGDYRRGTTQEETWKAYENKPNGVHT